MIPPYIRFADATHGVCDRCGAHLNAYAPYDLYGVAVRHVAESHPQTVSPNPPSG